MAMVYKWGLESTPLTPKAAPTVGGKITDPSKSQTSVRTHQAFDGVYAPLQIEEEESHDFSKGGCGNHKHQPFDPKRGKADGDGNHTGGQGSGSQCEAQRPLNHAGEHACHIGADRKKSSLGKAYLSGVQDAPGRKTQEAVDANHLR